MNGETISTSLQTTELSEAQIAYQLALQNLEDALPQADKPAMVDPTMISWSRLIGQAALVVPLALVRGIKLGLHFLRNEWSTLQRSLKGRLARFAQGQPTVLGGPEIEFHHHIRDLLLEVLWARDHIQEMIEQRNGASYASKRAALVFVMENENRLQQLGQLALEIAEMETSDLRDIQPTPPGPEHWWWYLNYPRAKRARRLSTLWFVLALVPALASVVLITLLAQRLAINGPDLLSSASVIAQVGLGLASIIAGREILNDLIMSGVSASWQGKLTFALASLFLAVVVIFYFLAPPGAAMIYHWFGERAVTAGNASEAELYLESAARLDPDPYAASLLEVGCLYQTLGAPDRAQSVFERVLEADSRLLLARFHLAQLFIDRGDYEQALQLLEDGLNLLDTARQDMITGDYDFLPGVDSERKADEIEYLLRQARGRAYLESNAPEQAKTNLRDAEELLVLLQADSSVDTRSVITASAERFEMGCGPEDDYGIYVLGTDLNLHYYLALTYDALCDDSATVEAAQQEWRMVRNGRPNNSNQEAWRDEAARRLSSGETCETNYGLPAGLLSLTTELPRR